MYMYLYVQNVRTVYIQLQFKNIHVYCIKVFFLLF